MQYTLSQAAPGKQSGVQEINPEIHTLTKDLFEKGTSEIVLNGLEEYRKTISEKESCLSH